MNLKKIVKHLPTLLAVILSSALSQSAIAATQVIHAGELLAVPGESPLKKSNDCCERRDHYSGKKRLY